MDTIVNSTKYQIEELRDSVLWADIVRELETWKQGFVHEALSIVDDADKDNPSSAKVLLHLGDINGRVKAIDYLLSLPEIFLSVLEEKRNDSERKSAE